MSQDCSVVQTSGVFRMKHVFVFDRTLSWKEVRTFADDNKAFVKGGR